MEIGYDQEPSWHQRWAAVTKLLRTLRGYHEPENTTNNLVVKETFDQFFELFWHMWDSLLNATTNPTGVVKGDLDAFYNEPANLALRICNGYANTLKHLKRQNSKTNPITAKMLNFKAGARRVHTVEYSSALIPPTQIEAMDLAEQSYQAWRDFFTKAEIVELQWIQEILNT